MSLINDALKKAQRQRTGDTPPSPLSAPPMPGGSTAPLRAQPKRDPSPALLLTGAGVAVALLIGGAGFWFFRSSGDKTPAASSRSATLVQAAKSTEPAPPLTTPVLAPAAAASPAVKPPEPTVALNIPPPATEVSGPSSPAPSAPATVTASVPSIHGTPLLPAPAALASAPAADLTTTASKPAEPAEPSERMITAIDGYRVMGIRASGATDTKVLMNDRVFRLGDLVDRPLGIRLVGATANSLTFKDASGATYTRNF